MEIEELRQLGKSGEKVYQDAVTGVELIVAKYGTDKKGFVAEHTPWEMSKEDKEIYYENKVIKYALYEFLTEHIRPMIESKEKGWNNNA